MMQQSLTDVFDDCINRLTAGQTVEECLRMYPAHAARLRPLLETGSTIRAMRVSQAELAQDKVLVWQHIEGAIPYRRGASGRGRRAVLQLLVAIFLLLLLLTATWFVLTRPDLPPDDEPVIVPFVETDTPTMTPSATRPAAQEAALTVTRTPSPSLTLTAAASLTASPTAAATQTSTPTVRLTPTQPPTATSECGAPLTDQDAVRRVLEIYPNTTVTSVTQQVKFGGTLVWEVQTSHGIEVNVEVACGAILTIEQAGDDADNSNQNANDNGSNDISNDNVSDPVATNTNSDDDANDSSDDNSGSGSDSSGMGSDD
jgi:hypothetical protein